MLHSLRIKRVNNPERLRRLSVRRLEEQKLLVHVDLDTRKALGSHRKTFKSYLGIIAREKVDILYHNWKQVPKVKGTTDLGRHSGISVKHTML